MIYSYDQEQGYPLSTLLFNTELKFLPGEMGHWKEIKYTGLGEKIYCVYSQMTMLSM